MYRIFKKIQSLILQIFNFIVYTAYIILPASLFIQVIFRYLFRRPLLGIEEIAAISFIWMVIFGIAILFKEKQYIIVDVVSQKFSEKMKKRITLVNNIIMTVILAILIYSSYLSIPFLKYYRSVVLGIPRSAHTIAFMISLLFMLICSIEQTILSMKQGILDESNKS